VSQPTQQLTPGCLLSAKLLCDAECICVCVTADVQSICERELVIMTWSDDEIKTAEFRRFLPYSNMTVQETEE
jgi:hypothetical protein